MQHITAFASQMQCCRNQKQTFLCPLNGVINLGFGVPKSGIKVVHTMKTQHSVFRNSGDKQMAKGIKPAHNMFDRYSFGVLFFRQQLFVFVH